MSDPMTNTEVEDVLASIRRLVSDDKRPEAKAFQKAPTDRLVLTPSLRVMEDDGNDKAQSVPDIASDDDGGDALTAFAATAFGKPADMQRTPQDAASPPAAGISDTGQEARDETIADTPDVMDAAHDSAMDDDDLLVLGDADAQDTAFEDVAAPVDDDTGEDVDWPATSDTMDAGARDPQDAPAPAADLNVPEDWADDVNDAHQAAMAEAVMTKDEQDPVEPAVQSLSEKIAALETLVGKRSDHFEPDDPGADAYAGTEAPAMEWEDADEAPPIYGASADAQPVRDEEPPAQIFSSDEDVLDEEALRELVSDIVREELQGALGERITRNVRKLVRREIHRALAAQDLE